MAWLETIEIRGLRNISSARLANFSQFNLVLGSNGMGKTSIVEAIHLLGLGRSFRTANPRALIHSGQDEVLVRGVARASRESKIPIPLAIQKYPNNEKKIQIGGQRCRSAVELADVLPLQLLDSSIFQLVEGPPKLRRQYLDWGVFHVEHQYLGEWRRLQRTLKQRNSLLRRGKMHRCELDSWDASFAMLADAVTARRERYFKELLPVLKSILSEMWAGDLALDFAFQRGWDRALSYREALAKGLSKDVDSGYTHVGPHRADLRIRVMGLPVAQVLSRGQLKILASSLRLAQAALFKLTTGKSCVFLVDDLPAELDERHRRIVCSELDKIGCEVFITSIDAAPLVKSGINQYETSVFHVEHGKVNQA